MSEAARVAEEAKKLIRIVEEGNKAYVQHTLTYGQIVSILHLVVRLAEVAMELEAAMEAVRASEAQLREWTQSPRSWRPREEASS